MLKETQTTGYSFIYIGNFIEIKKNTQDMKSLISILNQNFISENLDNKEIVKKVITPWSRESFYQYRKEYNQEKVKSDKTTKVNLSDLIKVLKDIESEVGNLPVRFYEFESEEPKDLTVHDLVAKHFIQVQPMHENEKPTSIDFCGSRDK